MANSVDPDQFRSQLIWICTVCKGRLYPGSTGQGLKLTDNVCCCDIFYSFSPKNRGEEHNVLSAYEMYIVNTCS